MWLTMKKTLWDRLFHGQEDYHPGQPVLVHVFHFDGTFPREVWERAKFLGRDDGGHPMIEFKDGTKLKLQNDQRLMG